MLVFYKIFCEWDMGFNEAYSTKEDAMDHIKQVDWSCVGYNSYEEVLSENLVYIEVVDLNDQQMPA